MIRDAIEHAFEEKLIVLSSPCVHASFPLLPLGGVCLAANRRRRGNVRYIPWTL
jgi:hypothetical protein